MVPAIPLIILFSFLVYWSLLHDRPSYLEMQRNHLEKIDSLKAEMFKIEFDLKRKSENLNHAIDIIEMKHKQKEDSLKMVIEFLEYQQSKK